MSVLSVVEVKLSVLILIASRHSDITKDFGYGQCRGRAAKNGPLGGLPAFCRFGAFISTSPLTNVLAEVWLRE